MLLHTELWGNLRLVYCSIWGQSKYNREIMELAQRKLTAEGINNEMLLRTDIKGKNAWHIAA